ncbi:MAG: peptidoglycan-binding protein [Selenomonadaceae bacterium]|nr:peptidoglycan-binding protein [Selenomonadaceae bacterium]
MQVARIIWTLVLVYAISIVNVCAAESYKSGDKGEVVREIQDCLIAQCLLSAAADGVYGPATVKAIQTFQSAIGLKATGICDEETYKILHAAAYNKIDITTYKPGDYVPEPPTLSTAKTILKTAEVVKTAVNYANLGDVIKQGAKGEGVVYLQTKLRDLGFYKGKIDGICDVGTVDALKKFQSSRGIKSDGICGRKTYSALEDMPLNLNVYDDSTELPDYTKVIHVEATAYSSKQPGLSAYTSTGVPCRRGVIAVDPKVIPLGTKVFIPGYGYAVAADIGSAIRGSKIDVAFDSIDECRQFGRKKIKVYLVD